MLTKTNHDLVEKNISFADAIAHKKKAKLPRHVDIDDLKSVAYFGLVQAANKFDPNKGIFTTYAFAKIVGSINDYLRSEKQSQKSSIEYDIPARSIDSNDVFEGVDEQTARVLNLYVFGNYSMKEIGEKYGLSESRICQIIAVYKKTFRKIQSC